MTDPISIKNDYYLPSDNEVKNPPQSMADPDIFLKILVAQMQYQDPMNPQDSSAFISQLSQMASMEQMYNVSRSMDSMASRYETANYYNLLGKNVTVLSEDKEKLFQVRWVVFYSTIKNHIFTLTITQTAHCIAWNRLSKLPVMKLRIFCQMLY